jgi:hypothetical protein
MYDPVFQTVTPKDTTETYQRLTNFQELQSHLGNNITEDEYLSAIYSGPIDIWSDNGTTELRNIRLVFPFTPEQPSDMKQFVDPDTKTVYASPNVMYVPNFYVIIPYQSVRQSLKKYNIAQQLFYPSNIISSLQNIDYSPPPSTAPVPNQPVTWTVNLQPSSSTLSGTKSQQTVITSNIAVDVAPAAVQTPQENPDMYPIIAFPKSVVAVKFDGKGNVSPNLNNEIVTSSVYDKYRTTINYDGNILGVKYNCCYNLGTKMGKYISKTVRD